MRGFKRARSSKSGELDRLRRELIRSAIWGVPAIFLLLDLFKVKAYAVTPLEPHDPGDIGAPRFVRAKDRDRKRQKTRLRPLEEKESIWKRDIWDRGKMWNDPFSKD